MAEADNIENKKRDDNDSIETVILEDKPITIISPSDIIVVEEAEVFKQMQIIKRIKNDSCCYKYCCKKENTWDDCFWFYYWYFFWNKTSINDNTNSDLSSDTNSFCINLDMYCCDCDSCCICCD